MRYFVGFLITIGLIIILIVLLLSGHGDNKAKTPQLQSSDKPKTVNELAEYANTDVVARATVSGQINADQTYAELRVTVGQNDVTYEQIQGYQNTVVNKQVYASNQSAYSNFLYAIGHSGFLLGNNNPKLANEKGYCPLGQRYVFELIENGKDIQRYWSTSCGNAAPRTYLGNVNVSLQLFQLQVPNFSTVAQNVQLSQ